MRSENSPNEQRQDDSAWLDFSMTTVALAGSGRVTGNNRPKFVNRANVKSPDVAQVGEMLYYFSAGFLTFEQWDFTSCLNADRPLLRLECRVAARVRLMAASGTWNPSCVAEAQMRTSILVLSLSNRAGENIA